MHILYGVWITGQGWLKVNNTCVAFQERIVAEATADRIGTSARVLFIDDSLSDLEPYFLSLEKIELEKKITIKKIIMFFRNGLGRIQVSHKAKT
jgi:hypothetical protein